MYVYVWEGGGGGGGEKATLTCKRLSEARHFYRDCTKNVESHKHGTIIQCMPIAASCFASNDSYPHVFVIHLLLV